MLDWCLGAGVRGRDTDLQGCRSFSRTRTAVDGPDAAPAPEPWPLRSLWLPSSLPHLQPGEQPGGEGVNQGSRGEGTGLCLAACQTLFSRGWREKGRVGRRSPSLPGVKTRRLGFLEGAASSASESLPSVEAGTSPRRLGRLWRTHSGARTSRRGEGPSRGLLRRQAVSAPGGGTEGRRKRSLAPCASRPDSSNCARWGPSAP